MNLESEKRYYLGWGIAFLGLALAVALQSIYADLFLSTGVFLIVVGIDLAIAAFIPKYEPLTLGSGALFLGAGVITLLSRYSQGNTLYGIVLIIAIAGVILLVVAKRKE